MKFALTFCQQAFCYCWPLRRRWRSSVQYVRTKAGGGQNSPVLSPTARVYSQPWQAASGWRFWLPTTEPGWRAAQLNYLKLAVAVIRLNGKTVAVFAGFLGFLCIIVRGLNLAWFLQLVLVQQGLDASQPMIPRCCHSVQTCPRTEPRFDVSAG